MPDSEPMRKPREIKLIKLAKIVKADWNYKSEGTREQIEKLAASIAADHSAGVLAVRPLGRGKYEAIDGNHRVDALRLLAWPEVPCEIFEDITEAQMITISKRRNHQWFEDDLQKLSQLMAEVVLPEIPLAELALIMPESELELKNLIDLNEYDFKGFAPGSNGRSRSSSSSNSTEENFENTEVDPEEIGEELNAECPRCKFRFKHS